MDGNSALAGPQNNHRSLTMTAYRPARSFMLAMRQSRHVAGWLCLCCALSVTTSAHAAIKYTITDLGTLGGTSSVGYGINSSGQVTGQSQTADGAFHAFMWTPAAIGGADGTMIDLGTLGGVNSKGVAINATGQVAGTSDTTPDRFDYHAFLWTPTTLGGANGSMLDLGTLGGTYSEGKAINADGQVAGLSFFTGDRATGGYIWTPATANGTSGTLLDLNTMNSSTSQANGINDSGRVTGYFYPDDPPANYYAFVYDSAQNHLQMLDGIAVTGEAINASGQITGRTGSIGGDAGRAFLWTPTTPNGTDGTLIDLGTLGGKWAYGMSINTGGQVTGISFTAGEPPNIREHAFVATGEGGIVDLNTLIDPLSGWELAYGAAINDAGQITGMGYFGGNQRAFLLTPVVPEPSSLALLVLGLPLVIRRKVSRSQLTRAPLHLQNRSAL
jgi:probable HAF family extracellular repeat protein